jgi:hypothetical protein
MVISKLHRHFAVLVFTVAASPAFAEELTVQQQIEALSARVAALEGELTPELIEGDYAVVGFRTGAVPISSAKELKGISVRGSTQTGIATVEVDQGVATLKVEELCFVGKGVGFQVGNTNLKNGVVAKVTGESPVRLPGETEPNPCVPDAFEGDVKFISGSYLEVERFDDLGNEIKPLQFYTAAGGRIWVLDNLDTDLPGTTAVPEFAAEFLMLIKTPDRPEQD